MFEYRFNWIKSILIREQLSQSKQQRVSIQRHARVLGLLLASHWDDAYINDGEFPEMQNREKRSRSLAFGAHYQHASGAPSSRSYSSDRLRPPLGLIFTLMRARNIARLAHFSLSYLSAACVSPLYFFLSRACCIYIYVCIYIVGGLLGRISRCESASSWARGPRELFAGARACAWA